MAVVLNASTTTGFTLTPDTSGTFAFQSNGTQINPVLTSATVQNSTSGTSIDFTGIPSWVKRITVMFSGVSTSGTSAVQIQLGTSSGFETTGYSSVASGGATTLASASSTTGLIIDQSAQAATNTRNGIYTISLVSSTSYVGAGAVGNDTTRSAVSGGAKTLSAALDRVRITTVNGTDTFDAGTINIMYE